MRVDKDKIINFASYLFIGITLLMVCVRRYKLGLQIHDIDEYIYNYEDFLAKGFYKKVAEGTSVLFYLVIYGIQKVLGTSVKTTFLIINILSQIAIASIGGSIILSVKNKKNKLLVLFAIVYYVAWWINDEKFGLSRNDLFLAVLSMLLFRILYVEKIKNSFVYVGIVLALMFSVRPITLLFLPGLFIWFGVDFYQNKSMAFKNVLKITIPFATVIGCLHFPSLIEHHKLSFYNKNKLISQAGYDWNDINTLATLRMFDEGKLEVINKNMYWGWNKEKVVFYKSKYGIEQSPKSFVSFVKEYPLYYVKLVGLNIFNVSVYFFRNYGLLFLLPLVWLYQKRKSIQTLQSPLAFFLITLGCLLIVLRTVIELRWLIAFEFLMFYAVFIAYLELQHKNYTKLITIASLILLIVFNLKSLVTYIV